MIPINNSDTAWLIVSDYNQDNNIPFEELREDILNPEVNDYYFELKMFIPYYVGGDNYHNRCVGSELGHLGGTGDIGNVGNITEYDKYDGYVGGNYAR